MISDPQEFKTCFIPAPVPGNEEERIAALRALDILDSAEEDIYNSITQAAAEVCQTSMASLTFIDEKRQWFKSRVGLEARETAREPAFCAHAINGTDLFLVNDALEDNRFRDNPFVTSKPHLRFYAGMPLVTHSGMAVGTLCVLDAEPRCLDERQATALKTLAASAMRVLELRQKMGVAVFAKAVDMTSDGITISSLSSGELRIMYSNESFLQMTGFDYLETIDQSPIFPVGTECHDAQNAFLEAMSTNQMRTVECQFRKKNGELRWARITFVPYVDDTHSLLYFVGVYRDITAVRETELQSQQLHAMKTTMASVAHVVKNFLNSAQLYSAQVNAQLGVDKSLQLSFEEALENTRAQLAAIDRMSRFKDRPTPFGFSVLDVEQR